MIALVRRSSTPASFEMSCKPTPGQRFTVLQSLTHHQADEGAQGAEETNAAVSSSQGRSTPDVHDDNPNLALYAEDLRKRPRLFSLWSDLMEYESTIPCCDQSTKAAECTKQSKGKEAKTTKLGTLAGVYLPCLQNIFGVILFLRLPWVVGNAGVLSGFLVVLLCCICTMLTAISMSAIATNGVVPAGGSYFMISRSLGPEFGGAVGLLFYIGTTFAASMYILGAVEILLTYIVPSISLFGDVLLANDAQSPIMLNNMRVYGTCLLAAMGLLVFFGVKLVNRFAFIFLASVLLSIGAIYVGMFTMHARQMPSVCYVGDHLLASTAYGDCSKNDSSLIRLYSQNPTRMAYFNQSDVHSRQSFLGIDSSSFIDNLFPHYLKKGKGRQSVSGDAGEVTADMTSSFTILLAIFFPSVSGIMAGSNRSGNLRDAQKSIPHGTIAAILTTSSVYLSCVLLFGATISGDVLRDKFGASIGGSLVVATAAWPSKWIILIGAFMSTVGAGLQSLTGAPRLLQAIAGDDLIPQLSAFAVASKSGEPQRALILTLVMSEIGIAIASLDAVAPIITMFLLMCYFFVNFACTLQSLLKTPNWRPRFRFYHWQLSLLGMLLCLALMFISSWLYSVGAMVMALFVYKYIEYIGAKAEWGDGLEGLSLSTARYALMRLEEGTTHAKCWRPQLLLICQLNDDGEVDEQRSRAACLFAAQLKAGKGLTIIGAVRKGVYTGNSVGVDASNEVRFTSIGLQAFVRRLKLKGFCKVIAAKDISEGHSFLIQGAGLGGLVPNTVVTSWPIDWKEKKESSDMFMRLACMTSGHKEALIALKCATLYPDSTAPIDCGHIDIWWLVHDGGMMLLLTFLLNKHKVWRACSVRVFTVAQLQDNSVMMKQALVEFLYKLRIPAATVEVIEMLDNDISEYAYERTLRMEQRREMLSKMQLANGDGTHMAQQPIENPQISMVDTSSHANDTSERQKEPSAVNVRRMNTAVKLNALIVERSADAKLVVVNLPTPWTAAGQHQHYMEFIDVLTESLDSVLLIRGAGNEVVTIYS